MGPKTAKKDGGKKGDTKKDAKGRSGKKGKGSTSGSSSSGGKGALPPDFFKAVIPANIIMGLLLGVLALCAFDPEDCTLIPGIGDALVDQSAILGAVLGLIMFVNLIMTLQVMTLAKKNNLDGKTTNLWLAQTMLSGPFSWKALRDADTTPPPKKKASSAGSEKKSPKKK